MIITNTTGKRRYGFDETTVGLIWALKASGGARSYENAQALLKARLGSSGVAIMKRKAASGLLGLIDLAVETREAKNA